MNKKTQAAAIEVIEPNGSRQEEVVKEPVCLESMVSHHLDEVSRLAYRLLGWEGQAEDVVQDVFVTAAEKIKTLRCPSSLKAWLFSITVNTCRTYRYKQKLKSGFLAFSGRKEKTSRAAGDIVAEEEKYAAVRQAVKNLPGLYREAVILKYLEQLSTPDVMQILRVNENTLNSRLMRARNLLRDKLGPLWETL
jgi:RNA polymerase sigma-70 factor (ECF subfamily)